MVEAKEDDLFSVPIAFITYLRLDTAKQVFEQIRKIKPKKLYHISDASNDPVKAEKVDQVRKYINDNIDWPCEVFKNYAETNMGCRKRINSGLDWVFAKEEKAIILEDDVVPEPSFFQFCEEMLEKYKDDERIFMITGNKRVYDYQTDEDYLFSNYCSIWGWATWARAWKLNESDMKSWPQVKKDKLLKKVYGENAALRLTRDMESVYRGEVNTWDYPWQLSKLRHGGLEIVPSVNLVKNVGMLSEDATHTFEHEIDMPVGEMRSPLKMRDLVSVDVAYDNMLAEREFSIGFFEKLIRKIVPQNILSSVRRFIRQR